MKENRILIIALVSLLVFLCHDSPAQLVTDLKNQPEGKSRNIRTGESLEAIRANALQTMDFGLEIMGDVAKMTSYLEYIVIFRWEETRDKYRSLWQNTWDWFETSMTEKKMDLTKQKDWRKKYDDFLDAVITDGEALVYWKWREEIMRKNLDYDIRAIPKEITELKNSAKEANALLTDAQGLINKAGATASDVNQALSKVDMAENLMEKVARYIAASQKFVIKERGTKKTSLDSVITQIRDRLKDCKSTHPDVMNQYTRRVSLWADEVGNYWEYYKKSWASWENVVKELMAEDLLKDYSYFKGVKYDDLTKVTERARQTIKAISQ
jgi:hypothetical protein